VHRDINVAIMNPNKPMIDGAAIGVRSTLLRDTQPSWSSATATSSTLRLGPVMVVPLPAAAG
jgi:hypothetical protein